MAGTVLSHTEAYLHKVIMRALHERVSESTEGVKIFDAGCGNGDLAAYLQSQGYMISACDISESGIRVAKEAWPDIRFEVMSVYEDMSQSFGSNWDVVTSSEVIEHLYEPRLFINNINKLLKPGGTLVLTTPFHGYLKNLALAAGGEMDRHFTVLWDGGHIKFWSFKTISQLLDEAGFTDIHFYGAGRLPWLWKSMVVSARKPVA